MEVISLSFGLMNCVISNLVVIATETWNLFNVHLTQVCLCLILSHCSLRGNGLTDTGAIALARALEHNKSLEELK